MGKLDCNIVLDLLPSYADELTSKATSEAIEEHLSNCRECTEVLQRMKSAEETERTPQPAEVDYLKKVRRHSRRSSLLISIVFMLIGMSLILFRFFYIGNNTDPSDLTAQATVKENELTITGSLNSTGLGVSRMTFSESGGIVEVKTYSAPKAFINRREFSEGYTASSEIKQVRVGDLIIWDDGHNISPITSQLFGALNPFIGDMPSNAEISRILGVADQFGNFTNELQTTTEPYGWSLILENPIPDNGEDIAKDLMTSDSYVFLASIDNLGYVTWKYDTPSGSREFTITEKQATDHAGKDIKQFASSVSELQKLLDSLNFK